MLMTGKKLQDDSIKLMKYFEESIGPYPWKQYSIIQGDGGMEYAMCTMITGERPYPSLVGVTAHEMAHAWFQHLLPLMRLSTHGWTKVLQNTLLHFLKTM